MPKKSLLIKIAINFPPKQYRVQAYTSVCYSLNGLINVEHEAIYCDSNKTYYYFTLQRSEFAFLLWRIERKYWQTWIGSHRRQFTLPVSEESERSEGYAKNFNYCTKQTLNSQLFGRPVSVAMTCFKLIDFVNILEMSSGLAHLWLSNYRRVLTPKPMT